MWPFKKKRSEREVVMSTEYLASYMEDGLITVELTPLGESLVPKFHELSPRVQDKLRMMGIYE